CDVDSGDRFETIVIENYDKKDSVDSRQNQKNHAPWDDFDYLQIVVYDLHGQARGRLVHGSAMEEIMELGQTVYSGICFSSIHGDLAVSEYMIKKYKLGSKYIKPDLSTLVANVTPVCQGNSIGHVICDVLQWDGSLDVSSPRTCAVLQLDKLKKLGLTLKSRIEFKFAIKGLRDKAEKGKENQYGMRTISVHQELFLEFMDNMKNMGVLIKSVQT
ncbi:uncharacterized protein LOC106014115, partial [Aplysia californica]|uniref:Uncharacterized protein LOC106014115 n=1 Tax=Aplysia californica TaxID=6500 RepID=A0ABM1AFF7_APLCA